MNERFKVVSTELQFAVQIEQPIKEQPNQRKNSHSLSLGVNEPLR